MMVRAMAHAMKFRRSDIHVLFLFEIPITKASFVPLRLRFPALQEKSCF